MQKGDETKEKIIQVSLELFRAKGYFNTSVNDIIEKTGIKKGGLYFHIQSKEKLAIKVLEGALENYETIISAGIENLSPLKRLGTKIEAIVNYHENSGLQKGCLFGNMALEIGMNDSDISRFIQKVFKSWESSFERMIKEAVESGELKLHETPQELAKMILASIEGGLMLSKISGELDSLKKCKNFLLKILDERSVKENFDKKNHLRILEEGSVKENIGQKVNM